MTLFSLKNGSLSLEVSSTGGTIEGFRSRDIPLLRPGKNNGVATDSSCFPLVPFGNRVSGNHFVWQGKEYTFEPNVDWDEHYLHGDSWLGEWYCEAQSEDRLCLAYHHRHGVYRYQATQSFHLTNNSLKVTLSVTNHGDETLPFGLGWHPFFPMATQTRVQAKANGYWLEREQWLVGAYQTEQQQDLDFTLPSPLPRHWVNNGYAGWNGVAQISQPHDGYAITMETDPPAPCYFIFVSDPDFDDGYTFDFFCFEPMSHCPDDHHRPGGGNLTPLAPGESTELNMTLRIISAE